eukprot:1714691-Pleurochrysis_carterae.AAC.1
MILVFPRVRGMGLGLRLRVSAMYWRRIGVAGYDQRERIVFSIHLDTLGCKETDLPGSKSAMHVSMTKVV